MRDAKVEDGETRTGEGESLQTMHCFGKPLEYSIRENENYSFITTRKNLADH